jgi:hypothetical protein
MPKTKFPKRRPSPNEASPDELGIDPGQVGPDSGGQSGDTQGLPSSASVGSESIEELVTEEQAFEASVLEGVADAGNHPERPVYSHERLK